MKIIYLSTLDPIIHAGVMEKISFQTNTWKKFGHKVKIAQVVLKKEFLKLDIPEDFTYYFRTDSWFGNKTLLKDIKEFCPDIIYLRSEIYKPFLYRIVKKYKTIIEYNSNELQELKLESKQNFFNLIRYKYYLITKNLLLKKARAVICVTHEIAELPYITKKNKNIYVSPNSIDLTKYKIAKTPNKYYKTRLFFIGDFNQPWTGIDKIINLAKQTTNDLEFHIVGILPEVIERPENVIFYGFLKRHEYENVIINCDIGIGPTSLYRKKMKEACPLKIREYLAYGLPSIIYYTDSAFINKPKPSWILQLPNSENNVIENIDKILNFCYKMKDVIVTHDESKKYIDSALIEKNKLNFMENLIRLEKK
ncbi:glycosyltransferase [bacterium]|nr:glycosyltransferase [bacterium]